MTDRLRTIYVVEDELSVREALDSFLRSAGFRVQLFASGRELLLGWNPKDASCLLLDVCLPEESGLRFQQSLAEMGISVPIVFMTGRGDVRMAVQAMKAGAVEFLTKPVDLEDLLNAIHRSIERGENENREREELESLHKRFSSLTPRENEVMQLVIAGLLNKQIAAEVGISEITVKIHRRHAMQKMEAKSLADLVRMSERLVGYSQSSEKVAVSKL